MKRNSSRSVHVKSGSFCRKELIAKADRSAVTVIGPDPSIEVIDK